ncbi:GYF domain-containing protein, partial [Shewanella sp.]|uniref:DUF4339 domain-containing protein n=1 Tax=Shewanella sp. TaxID=50422 RepID=UPI0035625CC6
MMMKKWFLSQDGELTGPLTEAEALTCLQDAPDSYGWCRGFSQWLPASHIVEFAGRFPTVELPAKVPSELIDEFSNRRSELKNTFSSVDEAIKFTKTYLYELEQEINIYKRQTVKLSDEVKQGIAGIESSYEGFQKVVEDLVYAVSMAKVEMNEVTAEFDKCLLEREKDVAAAPTPPKPMAAVLDADGTTPLQSPQDTGSPEELSAKDSKKDPVASAAKDAAAALKEQTTVNTALEIEPAAEVADSTLPKKSRELVSDNSEAEESAVGKSTVSAQEQKAAQASLEPIESSSVVNLESDPATEKEVVADKSAMDPEAAKPAPASNVGSEPEAKKAVVVDTPAMDPVAAKPAPASNVGSEPEAKKAV